MENNEDKKVVEEFKNNLIIELDRRGSGIQDSVNLLNAYRQIISISKPNWIKNKDFKIQSIKLHTE